MKLFIKGLAAAAILAVFSLFVLGCENPAGNDETPAPPPPPPPPPVLEDPSEFALALGNYFKGFTIDLTVPATGNPTGPVLTTLTPLTGAQGIAPYVLTGTLTYTGPVQTNVWGEKESPFITYLVVTRDAETFDRYIFTEGDAAYIAEAVWTSLGSFTNSRAADAGYRYIGSVVGSVVQDFNTGQLSLQFTLEQDAAADEVRDAISSIIVDETGVSITANPPLPAGSVVTYDSAARQLSLVLPIPGTSEISAARIAQAIFYSAVNNLTNNVDGNFRAVSAAGVNAEDTVTVTIELGGNLPAQAETIANAIPDPTGSNAAMTIAANGNVTGTPITSLQNIVNGTGTPAAALYDEESHTVTVTVPPRAGYIYITTPGAYDSVAAKFNALISTGTITNNFAGHNLYIQIGTATAGVVEEDMVVSFPVEISVQPATLTAAINGAANGSITTVASASSVTGNIITALTNITNGSGAVSASYSSSGHAIIITLDPPEGIPFNTRTAAYAAVATALNTKIGSNVTNDVEAAYKRANSTGAEVVGGKLVFTVGLNLPFVPATTISTASAVTGVTNNSGAAVVSAASVTGDIITALADITNGSGAVTTSYNTATHAISINIAAPSDYVFNTAANSYSAVVTVVQTKIGAAVTNEVEAAYTVRGTITAAVNASGLVLTVPLTAPAIAAADIADAVTAADDGNITVVNGTSVTGAVINALRNIPASTTNVGTAYNTSSNVITLTINPAAGRTFGTAATYNTVRDALVTQINAGTITNSIAPTYTIITGTPTVAVTAGNLVITMTLAADLPAIPAETIAAPINAAANGNISVTGVSTVTGSVIDALRNIPDATGVVGTAYNMGSGRQNATVMLTVLPASGKRFNDTVNFYTTGAGTNNLSTALNTKLTGAAVSNGIEGMYTILNGAPAVAVDNGNLIITITLRPPYVDPAPIATAISGAANGNITVASAASVTGPIVSALAGTGTVTTAYNSITHAIAITLAPPAGQSFDSAANAYSTVGAAVNAKLGATPAITNSVHPDYNLLKDTPTVAATGGNLVITINLTKILSDVTAATVVSAINGAANGNLAFDFSYETFLISVNGAVMTSLSAFGDAVGAYDFFSTLTITITPADGNRFIATTGAYSTAASALTTKLQGGTITNWDGSPLQAGTATAAVVNENLVFTVPVAAP